MVCRSLQDATFAGTTETAASVPRATSVVPSLRTLRAACSGGSEEHLAVQEDYAFTTKLSGQPLGPDGRHANLRRLLCDLIEEYGRHTGHGDLLREPVDGLVGEDPPPAWRARAGQSPVGS
jgi:hypothetical protein